MNNSKKPFNVTTPGFILIVVIGLASALLIGSILSSESLNTVSTLIIVIPALVVAALISVVQALPKSNRDKLESYKPSDYKGKVAKTIKWIEILICAGLIIFLLLLIITQLF